MSQIAYKITAGNWSVSSADDPHTELLQLTTSVSLFAPADVGRLVVYAPAPPKPSLLQQVAAAATSAASSALGLGGGTGGGDDAFSVDVRGQKIKLGDRLTVELSVDGASATVLTASIVGVDLALDHLTLTGRSDMHKLASARVNAVYENQTLGQIVRDLCGQLGVSTGEVDDGSTYAYVIVHESQSVLTCVRELARREGRDLYFDVNDRLTIKKFRKAAADHTLYYGIDLLDLHVQNLQPGADHVIASGESPSSREGADAWSWLVKDVSACEAEVGSGERTVMIRDGALRTRDAAGGAAVARLGALKDQAAIGRLTMLGKPSLMLGDAIELKNVPRSEMNGLFRVTGVRHTYGKRTGFVTRVAFSGQGGASKAESLPGQVAGMASALAGGLGL
jgi:hypothetical protein